MSCTKESGICKEEKLPEKIICPSGVEFTNMDSNFGCKCTQGFKKELSYRP